MQVVPDLGQVPELDPEVVTRGLETVVAFLQGDRVERDQQGPLSGDPGDQPPAAVSAGWAVLAGGGEGKSWRWGAPGPAGRVMVTGQVGAAGGSALGRPAGRVWFVGSGRAHPWPVACPCSSVTVTHHVVFGLVAAARARSRARAGSSNLEANTLKG